MIGKTISHYRIVEKLEGYEEPLAAEARPYRELRLSPDGTRLAISVRDADNSGVWIYDLARETFTRLTFDPAGSWEIKSPLI